MWYHSRQGSKLSLAFKIDRDEAETQIYGVCSYLILSGSAVCQRDDAAKTQLTHLAGTNTWQDWEEFVRCCAVLKTGRGGTQLNNSSDSPNGQILLQGLQRNTF